MHDLFALRRLASPMANDARHILRDHQDIMARLSAELLPPEAHEKFPLPSEPSPTAEPLLRAAIEQPAATVRAMSEADPDSAAAIKAFIVQPNVDTARLWATLFKSKPARLVVARVATPFEARAHHAGLLQPSKCIYLQERGENIRALASSR